MRLLRAVSLRRLRFQPLRTSLVVTGIALGVAILCSFNLLRTAIYDSFRLGIDAVAGRAHLEISGGSGGVPEEILERARAAPNVSHAAAVLEVTLPVLGTSPGDSVHIIGMDILGDDFFWGDLLHDKAPVADPLAFLNSLDAALVSRPFARARGLKEGDSFRVVTPNGVRALRMMGEFSGDGLGEAYGGDVAVMDLVAMQIVFGREGRYDRVQVALKDASNPNAAALGLRRALGSDLRIEAPATRGARLERMLSGFQASLTFSSGLALMVAMFLVYNAISIAIAERRTEIGTLRALGATLTQIRRLFLAEAAVLGAMGGLAGAYFGVLLARLLSRNVGESVSAILMRIQIKNIEARPSVLVASVVFGTVASTIAAYFPARAACKIPPAQAVRRAPPRPETLPDLRLALIGSAALGMAFLLVLLPKVNGVSLGGYASALVGMFGFSLVMPYALRLLAPLWAKLAYALAGLPGNLAAQNLARLPGRTAVTVSALGMAAAMVIGVGGFVSSVKHAVTEWLDDVVRADLIVTSSSPWLGTTNTPVPSDVMQDLVRLPGVADVDPLRSVFTVVNGERAMVLSHDIKTYERYGHPRYVAGDKETTMRELPRGGVTISENLANRARVGVGGKISLDTPQGSVSLPVVSIVVDYTSDAGLVRMDRAVYMRLFGDSLVDAFDIYLNPGVSAEQRKGLRTQIVALAGERKLDLRVYLNRELRQLSTGIIDQTFRVLGSLQGVAVLVAILGVLNTLFAAVLDRTREIGLLRALGATRRQIRVAIVAEATLVGLGSSVLAIPGGLGLGALFTRVINHQQSGWNFPFVVNWTALLQATLGLAIVAALSGLYPARRAARLEPNAALRAE